MSSIQEPGAPGWQPSGDSISDTTQEIPIIIVKSDSDEEIPECRCILEELLATPFAARGYKDKLNIVSNGRPTPSMSEMAMKTKSCIRHFKEQNYEMCPWLCGCEKLLKLFCWPCILFSTEANQWTRSGVFDLNNLCNLQKRHELSISHIAATLSLKKFKCELKESFRMDVGKFNQLVRKNSHVISTLVDVACFLSGTELPFNTFHEETKNMGNFRELVNLLRRYDDNLDTHIANSATFSRMSLELQNNLVDSIHQVLLDEIKKDITSCKFVSLIFQETTGIAGKLQVATIVRITDDKGDVFERFLGFKEFEEKNSYISDHILNVIQEEGYNDKVISLSYNTPSFLSPSDRMCLIKDRYPNVYFLHCYSYEIFSNFKDTVNDIEECKRFFWTLIGLESFFFKSSRRMFSLQQEIRKSFPSHNNTRWQFKTTLLASVFVYRFEIVRALESMVEEGAEWDTETYISANGFLSQFKKLNFNFLLHLFVRIYPDVFDLFQHLKERNFTPKYYKKAVEEYQSELHNLKNEYNSFWSELESSSCCVFTTNACKRVKLEHDMQEDYRGLYYKIIDAFRKIIEEQRFYDMGNLYFIALLEPKCFPKFDTKFPAKKYFCLENSVYSKLFNITKLRYELCVLYSDVTFRKADVYELHKFLCTNELEEILPEVSKLAKLIVTLPLAEPTEKPPASQRITAFLDNYSEGSPSTLSLLSIEKNLLSSIKLLPNFHEKVLDNFSQKAPHIELTYKN